MRLLVFSSRPASLLEARRGARAEQRAMATKTDLRESTGRPHGEARGKQGKLSSGVEARGLERELLEVAPPAVRRPLANGPLL